MRRRQHTITPLSGTRDWRCPGVDRSLLLIAAQLEEMKTKPAFVPTSRLF